MTIFLLNFYVTKATLVSQLTYAAPAWSGFLSETDTKLQKDDGRYPNRLAFLITDCNLFVSVSDKKNHSMPGQHM